MFAIFLWRLTLDSVIIVSANLVYYCWFSGDLLAVVVVVVALAHLHLRLPICSNTSTVPTVFQEWCIQPCLLFHLFSFRPKQQQTIVQAHVWKHLQVRAHTVSSHIHPCMWWHICNAQNRIDCVGKECRPGFCCSSTDHRCPPSHAPGHRMPW